MPGEQLGKLGAQLGFGRRVGDVVGGRPGAVRLAREDQRHGRRRGDRGPVGAVDAGALMG